MPLQTSNSIQAFRGLDERLIKGTSPVTTSSLQNVEVRNGLIRGRLGFDEFDSITTAASAKVIGLFGHYANATSATSILRMLPTKVEKWNGAGAWTDITGTALTGTATTRPCFANMPDEGFSLFTNEGHDRPRKYTGTGNTVVLGGTPPFAKWLVPYVGFLFLFNTSTDGTFSAVADPVTAYFSDTPDSDWVLCDGNALVYDETAGELVAAGVFGDSMVVFKADGIVNTRFVGGLTRFNRRKLNFAHGLMAAESLQHLGRSGMIFLGTDLNLYITDGQQVQELPPNVQKSLQEDLLIADAPFVHSFVDLAKNVYKLMYTSGTNTVVLKYNYTTGEFAKDVLPVIATAGLGFRLASTTAYRQLVADTTLVYELDTKTDDNGTSVSRYYDLDWSQFGAPGNKWLTSVKLVFQRARDCRVRLSIAVDDSSKFRYKKTFSLQGNDPDDVDVILDYNFTPTFGTWFKLRIEFLQDALTQAVLKRIEPEYLATSSTSVDTHNLPEPLSA